MAMGTVTAPVNKTTIPLEIDLEVFWKLPSSNSYEEQIA